MSLSSHFANENVVLLELLQGMKMEEMRFTLSPIFLKAFVSLSDGEAYGIRKDTNPIHIRSDDISTLT